MEYVCQQNPQTLYFRFVFSYNSRVMDLRTMSQPVLTCKGCSEAIPIRVMPTAHIIRTCPLCGERRRSLSSEAFHGNPSYLFKKKRCRSVRFW